MTAPAPAETSFADFLSRRLEAGGFTTDEALTALLPLVRQVVEAHEAGRVAPLDGVAELFVNGNVIYFKVDRRAEPKLDPDAVSRLDRPASRALEVVGEAERMTRVEDGATKVVNLRVGKPEEPLVRPIYLPGWRNWEQAAGHHDALTDVFSLGMLLGGLSCGLDFGDPADLEQFVSHRGNLFALRPQLHPVVAKAIVRMTELSRPLRAQDLPALLARLEHYREAGGEEDFKVEGIKGFREADLRGKRGIVLTKLRERLFEISRRNRLLYFRPSLQSLNLTFASVPVLIDVAAIRPDQLFTWQGEVEKLVSEGKPVPLGKYLRFEDAPYLPEVLDKILNEAKRDQAEFGFAQLRLVLCFLRWHNLKEDKNERIDSPLLLLPVRLSRKKGVRDAYLMEPTGTVAEVNPVLRHTLKQLYDISLPEAIDLAETTLHQFHEVLAKQIHASEPGVTLKKIDRPQIEMIHDRARRRLDQYQRRLRVSGRGVKTFGTLDYSYDRENFQPLGLRLFQNRVRPSPAPLREIVEQRPVKRSFAVDGAEPEPPVSDRSRRVASFREGGEANPYSWDFDLCSLTLGNFKYRKMSLVRDYESLLEEDLPNPSFDSVFSLMPRAPEGPKPAPPPLQEQFPVVPCDPTQTSAIACSRDGKSFIIQGPPGTGKSQTITNLIADFVARGKHVLFVCEKRAALDVVFHRLRQTGLGDVCTLIHDSQTDKKEFILDLKVTYEKFLKEGGEESWADAEGRRGGTVKAMETELAPIRKFNETMSLASPASGIPVCSLLQRRLETQELLQPLTPVQAERVPEYRHWTGHRDVLARLASALRDLAKDGLFASHPLRLLHPDLSKQERPLEVVVRLLGEAESALGKVVASLRATGLPGEQWDEMEEGRQLVNYAFLVQPLAERDQLALLSKDSPASRGFSEQAAELQRLLQARDAAREAAKGWKERLPRAEIAPALEQARAFEKSTFSFFKPAWWRLRKILNSRYNFASHVVRPSWVRVVETLEQVVQAEDACARAEETFKSAYGQSDGAAAVKTLDEMRRAADALQGSAKSFHERVSRGEAGAKVVLALASIHESLDLLSAKLNGFLVGFGGFTFPRMVEELARIRKDLDRLPDFIPVLADVAKLPEPVAALLREAPLTVAQLEAAMADRTLRDLFRADRFAAAFGGPLRERHARRLEAYYEHWLKSNSACVRDRVRRRFLQHAALSTAPPAKLTDAQKVLRTDYAAGRRDLEHEFGKTMRYKSIRELLAKQSGGVILDLKPVWLMSPLSVSDTLPLDVNRFDVVIFDEASQIPLENAIPSVFRADQIIVVGDEQQLPPTNFFSAKRGEEEGVTIEEDDEVVEYDLDSDSFLNHACRNLPSTLLGWHYRSRSEALISFSNASFYQGELLTVPDRRTADRGREEIRVTASEEGGKNVERLLDRSLSFHYLEKNVYDNRRNPGEAAYIAQLVRELLQRKTGLSIGIIAFSEAQQDEIERGLDRLAREDAAFRDLLDAELEREDDGQFVGLLVKNLENIQGDERDVVILSICYGPGPDGRMMMNFGPINQSGGEKRLNVAFSRAKRHMAIVSSIHAPDVKNVYNAGANCLRNYLQYAEHVSAGDLAGAKRVLQACVVGRESKGEEYRAGAVARQLADALRAKGYEVDSGVGQSKFRCDLAVRKAGEPFYRAAVVVDTPEYYRQSDLMERELLKPRVLRAFDWRVCHILAKDWLNDRAGVMERLEQVLEGKDKMEAVVIEPESIAPVPPVSSFEELEGAAAPAPAPISAAPPAGGLRRFEFVEGGSSKFWAVSVAGVEVTVHFGRIGTEGQVRSKSFPDAAGAKREAEGLIREKLGKGYKEKT
jgi:predicted DNA-binding WGR domain protein